MESKIFTVNKNKKPNRIEEAFSRHNTEKPKKRATKRPEISTQEKKPEPDTQNALNTNGIGPAKPGNAEKRKKGLRIQADIFDDTEKNNFFDMEIRLKKLQVKGVGQPMLVRMAFDALYQKFENLSDDELHEIALKFNRKSMDGGSYYK